MQPDAIWMPLDAILMPLDAILMPLNTKWMTLDAIWMTPDAQIARNISKVIINVICLDDGQIENDKSVWEL